MKDTEKKIIVLNGSPRKDNSVTMVATRAFVKGIENASGFGTEYINISELYIKPCLGCLSCWGRTEGRCVIEGDDIERVKRMILNAHYVVESFPLYFFGMPGIMKVFTDRMLCMMNTYTGQNSHEEGKSVHGIRYENHDRKFVIISSCAYTETENVYKPLLSQFDYICGNGNYTAVTVPQLKNLVDAATEERMNKYLKNFVDAGEMLVKSGRVDDETLKVLSRPPFSNAVYTKLLNNFWEKERRGQ
ncbi:MAG: flavodoxin family protein [Clostridiales bacterium]|nr:flavodoxin family protein [Clostridiales bacterium]